MSCDTAAPRAGSDKLRAALLYMQHIAVMVEWEARKLRKDPTELLIRGVQPALWLLIFGQAFSRIRGIPTDGATYSQFLTPGILAQSVTFISIFYGISIIWERDVGVLQKTLSTPMHRSAFMFGKMLSASLRSISQTVIILVLSVLIGTSLDWGFWNLLGVVFSIVLGASFFAGLSVTLASLVKTRERMMGIGQLISMPLFFASSALYPIDIMPEWLKWVARVNPLSYLVDSLRGLLLPTHAPSLASDWLVLLASVGLVALIGTYMYPRIVNG